MPVTAAQQNAARRLRRDGGFEPVGAHTQNATISAATTIDPSGLADSIESVVNAIVLQANGRDIRYTLDGTTPTATVGFLLPAGGSPVLLHWANGVNIRVIETAATATLVYQWGRVQ